MRMLTYTEAFREAVTEEMELDPKVLYLGEDIRHGGIFQATKGLFERFGPDRVIATPICEASFLGVALGLALTGFRPVVEVMWADFTLTAADSIINSIAKMRFKSGGRVDVPLMITTRQGGWIGHGNSQSQCVEAFFGHFPGIDIVIPATPADARGLVKTAIRSPNPILVIQPKSEIYGSVRPSSEEERAEFPLWARGAFTFPVPDASDPIPLGKADIKRTGDDVTVVTWGSMLSRSLRAADECSRKGISVEIMDLRSLSPLDYDSIFDSVRRTHRLVIAHEDHVHLGLGGAIAARVQKELFGSLAAPISIVGAKDLVIPFSAPLENAVLPSVTDVLKAIEESLGR